MPNRRELNIKDLDSENKGTRLCEMKSEMSLTPLTLMLLLACASNLIITSKNSPKDEVRLMGQGDSFECNDSAYAGVKKVESATLVFTDGMISLCRPADAVARRDRNVGSAPRAPMPVGIPARIEQ